MAMSVSLSPDVEARLQEEAAKRRIPVEDLVASVVASAVPSLDESDRRGRALAALAAVSDMGTEIEQRETFNYLARAIDEDRMSDRKLFT